MGKDVQGKTGTDSTMPSKSHHRRNNLSTVLLNPKLETPAPRKEGILSGLKTPHISSSIHIPRATAINE